MDPPPWIRACAPFSTTIGQSSCKPRGSVGSGARGLACSCCPLPSRAGDDTRGPGNVRSVCRLLCEAEPWSLQVLPDGLIYAPYLAGPKESRTAVRFFRDTDEGWLFDARWGGRLASFATAPKIPLRPREFSSTWKVRAQFRGTGATLLDILSTDVRVGIPLTIGWGKQETKLAVYVVAHVSQPRFR